MKTRNTSFLLFFMLLTATGKLVSAESVTPDRTMEFLVATAAPVRNYEPGDPPNVLFIFVDDLNVAIGAYDRDEPHYATVSTPNIDRLASEGIRFSRAYVQNPLCNPSRTSILSGLRPASTEVFDGATWPRHKIGSDLRMMPEHFRDHGYFTGRVGKIAHNSFEHSVSWDFSRSALSREPAMRLHAPGFLPGHDLSEVRDNTWTEGSDQGMSRRDVLQAVGRRSGLPLSWRATHESPRMTPDGTTATRIVQLMAENRDRPFFIAAGFHKPHQPWVGPVRFFRQHPVRDIALPDNPHSPESLGLSPAVGVRSDDAALTKRQRKQAIAAYHATVTMTDSYVGELMQALDELGIADSTIVVFTSDHGFMLGEHGLWRKQFQYQASIQVPLIVRLPNGRKAGETVHSLVELVDLYPTLIELCELPDTDHKLEGESFVPLLHEPRREWKRAVFSESVRDGYHGRSVITDRYRYTKWSPLNADREVLEELYDLVEDPLELVNLARDSEKTPVLGEHSELLQVGWRSVAASLNNEHRSEYGTRR